MKTKYSYIELLLFLEILSKKLNSIRNEEKEAPSTKKEEKVEFVSVDATPPRNHSIQKKIEKLTTKCRKKQKDEHFYCL